MAYNRRNLLNRMIQVQDITLEYTSKGVKQEFIFEHYVKPRFVISRPTFYNWLGHNAKAELKKMNEVKQQQLCLF